MLFGNIFFWILDIVSLILLYHILFCIYEKSIVKGSNYCKEYEASENDKRLKLPIGIIILLCVIELVPILNILVYSGIFMYVILGDSGPRWSKYYFKSVFTKRI